MTAKVLTITSGKGGVGKTTSSAAIGAALALRGLRTVVIDFDTGLRKLDLAFGVENRVVFDLIGVATGKAKLNQALVKAKDPRLSKLSILPTSQIHEKDALTAEGLAPIITQLKQDFDWIICDSPAGIEHGAVMAFYHADHVIVVVNAEVSSIRDSDRILGMIQSKSRRTMENIGEVHQHLLITRYNEDRVRRGKMIPADKIVENLSIDLLGVIPESEDILEASNTGIPATLDLTSEVGRAYDAAVARFLGEDATASPIEAPAERGWLRRLLRLR